MCMCVRVCVCVCDNFSKIGVGDQGLPDPYSSASVSSNEG